MRAVVVLILTAGLALAVGCSSSSSGGSTSPAASPAPTSAPASPANSAEVCADYDALKQSLADLVSLNVVSAGRDGLEAALGDVATKLASLKSSAQQQFAPQIDKLQQAVDELQTTLGDVSSTGLSGSVLKTIARQLVAIGTAGRNLGSAIRSTCPGATSS